MFNLDYKASNIRNAEQKYSISFFDAIVAIGSRSISMTNLMFLYACGGATEEDFDKDLKQSMQKVVVNIFEKVDQSGFLGQDLDIEAMKEAMGVKDTRGSSTKPGKETKA